MSMSLTAAEISYYERFAERLADAAAVLFLADFLANGSRCMCTRRLLWCAYVPGHAYAGTRPTRPAPGVATTR